MKCLPGLMLSIMMLSPGCYDYCEKSDDPDYRGCDPRIRLGIAPTVMFMGDSRADFGGSWDELPYTVINVGTAGSTTWGIMLRLGYVWYYRPQIVVIFTGVNDVLKFSTDEFAEKLELIVSVLEARGIHVIIADITINGENNAVEANRQIMMTYDNYLPISYNSGDYVDGCHLSLSGYDTAGETIKLAVEEYLKSL